MKKFLVIYAMPAAAMKEMMESTNEEERENGMDEWVAWMESNRESFADRGNPAGKNTRVTKNDVIEMSNDIGGYSIMQGYSKEAVIEVLQMSPHFKMSNAYIEVMEVVEM